MAATAAAVPPKTAICVGVKNSVGSIVGASTGATGPDVVGPLVTGASTGVSIVGDSEVPLISTRNLPSLSKLVPDPGPPA